MTAWLRPAWERLALYLPILLMGLFALGTWWLVRSTPSGLAVSVAKPPRHEADYFMKGFAIRTFDGQGRLKTELFGALAEHYPDTDTLEIAQVRMRSFSADGRMTVATASQALSSADGSEVQLMGNVHLIRDAAATAQGAARRPMEYRGEFLKAFTDSEKLVSHLPVLISQGPNRFNGSAMRYDNVRATIELQGQVRGVLVPGKTP